MFAHILGIKSTECMNTLSSIYTIVDSIIVILIQICNVGIDNQNERF